MLSKKEVLAMSNNKKFAKLAVLSLMGILGLTACGTTSSEIVAKPSNYDDPIVIIKDGEEEADIHNNILKIIEDAIHDGSIGSEVLKKVLYKYAESIYGTYNSVTAKGSTETTLYAAYNEIRPEEAGKRITPYNDKQDSEYPVANAFIKKHKVYWLFDEDDNHINSETKEIITDEEAWVPGAAERELVVSKYEDAIEKRIAISMYNKISSGTYTKKHFFSEFDFVKALYFEGKKVDYATAQADKAALTLNDKIIDYRLEKEDVFTDEKYKVLTRSYYQNSVTGATYIEDEIIPEVYNDLLVEQYLLDQELSAVRNSRARRINVLKIEKYSSWPLNADILMKNLVNEIYDATYKSEHVRFSPAENEEYYTKLFKKYEIVSKGLYAKIQADDDAKALIEQVQKAGSDIFEVAHTHKGEADDIVYYKKTAYGDLVEEFKEFVDTFNPTGDDAWANVDMTLYNKFTSSGTCTPEEGFDQARIDLDQNKAITKGWFINNSQPSLDSNGAINERLFALSVANDKKEIKDEESQVLGELEQYDRFERKGAGTTADPYVWQYKNKKVEGESNFLCSINGAYFLKFDGQSISTDPRMDIVYDDGSAYYIVQVIEAVKDSKLRRTGAESYANTRGEDFLNEIIDAVSTKVAETGSYATLAKEHWLKKMNITYHDQKVYDYFKENYPDLFE